tara:strand:+ start:322 stop:753 length:432 start_codon:yes stop_codon:yes gene_type:complete
MIIRVFFFYFIFTSILLSDDYVLEALGDFSRKEIKLDNKVFTIFETNFKWKDSYGEFGVGYCIGHMENIKNNLNLYNLCENTDSKGEKFWLEGIRKNGEERGVGTLTYIKATEKYKKFLNKICNYGVSWYNQDSFFLKQKCKF